MTFEWWLLKQIKRQDAVGDLARSFKFAKKSPFFYDRKRVKIEETFQVCSPSWIVYSAYEIAKIEYEKWCKQHEFS
jgi:hypothetical protein